MSPFIKQTTLCYLKKENKYLMLHRTKKNNDSNKNKWIAIGGKFEDKECPEECMQREVLEETGLKVLSWRYAGIVTFVSDIWEEEMMHIFESSDFEGIETSTQEGELAWIESAEINNLHTWAGDKIFFDLMQKEIPFFSLKLRYEGEALKEVLLNGKIYELHKKNS